MSRNFVGMRIGGELPRVYAIERTRCRYLVDYVGAGDKARHALDWGCRGPRAQDLAFALLFVTLDDGQAAATLTDRFAVEIVAGLPKHGWIMDDEFIHSWVIAALAGRRMTLYRDNSFAGGR